MKMNKELYERLESSCKSALAEVNQDLTLVKTTYDAWEVFHYVANKWLGYAPFYGPEANLNDVHIETALKRIFNL